MVKKTTKEQRRTNKNVKTKANEAFRTGYDDCLIDCLTYMMEDENLPDSDKIMQQLVNYILMKRTVQLDKNLIR